MLDDKVTSVYAHGFTTYGNRHNDYLIKYVTNKVRINSLMPAYSFTKALPIIRGVTKEFRNSPLKKPSFFNRQKGWRKIKIADEISGAEGKYLRTIRANSVSVAGGIGFPCY
eukprot:UN00394